MQSTATTVEDYLKEVPAERKEAFGKLRKTILENLPNGFKECMQYGMIGYVVPHSIYPDGYHCNPKQPLPFINLASQKHFIGFYHSGISVLEDLTNWFTKEYASVCKTKLDMGKCCVRLKKLDDIPFALIGQLVSKISVDEWISIYEARIKK